MTTKKTFVVWAWNGEKYDDSMEWIEAVMLSKRAALNVIKRLRDNSHISRWQTDIVYSVVEWQGEKSVAIFDQDGTRKEHV